MATYYKIVKQRAEETTKDNIQNIFISIRTSGRIVVCPNRVAIRQVLQPQTDCVPTTVVPLLHCVKTETRQRQKSGARVADWTTLFQALDIFQRAFSELHTKAAHRGNRVAPTPGSCLEQAPGNSVQSFELHKTQPSPQWYQSECNHCLPLGERPLELQRCAQKPEDFHLKD